MTTIANSPARPSLFARVVIQPGQTQIPTRATAQTAWLQLKEAQRREDGTSARIEGEHLMRLESAPSAWPVEAEAAPVIIGANEVDAARLRALPAIRRAVNSLRLGPTRGDAA